MAMGTCKSCKKKMVNGAGLCADCAKKKGK
jgi:hypothetical protein